MLFQDGLVFVVGRRNSQLTVSGRQHSADDIIGRIISTCVFVMFDNHVKKKQL